jgi:hypothetical protein
LFSRFKTLLLGLPLLVVATVASLPSIHGRRLGLLDAIERGRQRLTFKASALELSNEGGRYAHVASGP